MAKLWGGRFKKRADPQFERFSRSLQWDSHLLPYELRIDLAHVRALKGARVLTAKEAGRLSSALRSLERGYKTGRLKLDRNAEDVHSAVHSAVAKIAGPLAEKLHTGRSRNELVCQGMRLYCLDHARRIAASLSAIQREWLRLADRNQDVRIAGRTHWEKAQPVVLSHVFLAYVEMLERSKRAVVFAGESADVCVLGSGALAGSTFALDQKRMARELGLRRIVSNSYDAVGDRGFIFALLGALQMLGIQLSRIAEQIMLEKLAPDTAYEIGREFCTGSSMMPQKVNADMLELTRGASAVFAANFAGLSTLMKGTAMSYNRDYQWDKKFLVDSVDTVEELLEVFRRTVSTISVDRRAAARQVSDPFLYATDVADLMVRKGRPFAEAHALVGRYVTESESTGAPLSDLMKDARGSFDADRSVRMKKTIGSTHPDRIKAALSDWKKRLRAD
ncbi:MAG TPA: argininosuccinate lyase [Candidatus Eisenbacteria bacterium]|jgi:argininosuccinate lyase|nr:argininosuccinate lyase [Candidatus Eisenbacteria bacterium]